MTSTRRMKASVLVVVVISATVVGCSGSSDGQPQGEVACMEQLVRDPANQLVHYPPAIGAGEHTDSIRSGSFPCATFTGDRNGPNQVVQSESETNYGNIQFISLGGPDRAFLQGGGLGGPGIFISRFDPSTGKEIWRTYLNNFDSNGQWHIAGSLMVLEDGSVGAAQGPDIWRVDPESGAILAYQQQPILGMPATDANFDGFHVAPDERGTILFKTQTRSAGCPIQFTQAIAGCQDQYGPPPDTTVIAADPKTLQNLAAIKLDQAIVARPIVTKHNGRIYMYMAGTKNLVRVIWDPIRNTLTQDTSWAPQYLLPGQGAGDAPGILGDWVISNTNGAAGSVPMSVVAVHQDDPTRLVRINPWGTTLPPGVPASESPASFGIDPLNNMIFAQDWFVGGVYAIQLDQATGDMQVVWNRPDIRTNDFFESIGPAHQRVLVSQFQNPNWTPADVAGGQYNYTEGVIWLDQATGKTLAQSSYDNPSTAPGVPQNPGYGGRIYTMGNQGTIFIYQVAPCSTTAATPAVPQSVTHC